jgi:hypothetical protein
MASDLFVPGQCFVVTPTGERVIVRDVYTYKDPKTGADRTDLVVSHVSEQSEKSPDTTLFTPIFTVRYK